MPTTQHRVMIHLVCHPDTFHSFPPSSIRRMFLRRSPLKLLSKRQIRYITIAFVLVIFIVFLPHHPSLQSTPKKHNRSSPFRIQFEFQKESSAAKRIRLDRQQNVRKAFLHAWKGYSDHAWMHDELSPLSGNFSDPYVGWAATLVDGLDALYILGLDDEFKRALKALKSIDFTKPNAERVPVFETTIRYLGGMLGAYDVSGGKYPILLKKADELGEFLFRSFATPNGIPVPYYWWGNPDKKLEGEDGVLIAQIGEIGRQQGANIASTYRLTLIGSLSLEFTRLAQLTGKRKYFDGISKITNYLDFAQNHTQVPGLWPSQVDTRGPTFDGGSFTLGAWADSLYEYLPKVKQFNQHSTAVTNFLT